MGVDKEELEATRKLREKTADKMFEELGYEKVRDEFCEARYMKKFQLKRPRHIMFYVDRTIRIGEENEKELVVDTDTFGMQELQAINKKVEELGWTI